MARPASKELRFIMLDVNLDEKITRLRLRYGNDGFAVWLEILRLCYAAGKPELFVASEADYRLIARGAFVDESEYVETVVEFLLELEVFDRKAFLERQVLTSDSLVRRIRGIQNKRERDRDYDRNRRGKTTHDDDPGVVSVPETPSETETETVPESERTLGILDLGSLDRRSREKETVSPPPPGKTPHGENGFVWLKPSEEQRFRTELGEDGFRWCVDRLDGWVRGKIPDQGRLDRDAKEAIRKGRNARHTFNSWVVAKWHEHSATLADAAARKSRALNGPVPFQTAAERRAAANKQAGDEFVAEANARAQRRSV